LTEIIYMYAVCGVWCVVCGVWCVVCGLTFSDISACAGNESTLEQCMSTQLQQSKVHYSLTSLHLRNTHTLRSPCPPPPRPWQCSAAPRARPSRGVAVDTSHICSYYNMLIYSYTHVLTYIRAYIWSYMLRYSYAHILTYAAGSEGRGDHRIATDRRPPRAERAHKTTWKPALFALGYPPGSHVIDVPLQSPSHPR
jgi:hypothetical protein